MRKNTVAVISDGTAVLGLGNIGPIAALPVMEGKAVIFKEMGDIDAIPLVLDEKDPKKIMTQMRVVIVGAGAAGTAIAKLLLAAGLTNVTVADSKGPLNTKRADLTGYKKELAKTTNPEKLATLGGAIAGVDVLVGVSGPGTITPEMIKTMSADAIVFALANPIP